MIGFASKVMGHVTYGLAAGCAAVAQPRRPYLVEKKGLCPWFGVGPHPKGAKPLRH